MTTVTTKDDLLKAIKLVTEAIEKESMARLDIERTKDFQAIEKDIADTQATIAELQKEVSALYERGREMLAAVPDTRPKLEELKRMLIEVMKIEGMEGYNYDWITVSGKFSESRKVDGKRLLEVLGGDIDEFVSLVKPTQKAIKDYAAEHDGMKKELLNCIRLEGRELVSVDIQLPEIQ